MDEFARIEAMRRLLGDADLAELRRVELGIGDDAAVLAPSRGRLVLSVDTAVEGIHFRADFAPLEVLGRRAVMAAASDLAAMGAEPRCALSAVTVPPDLEDGDLLRLTEGVARASRELAMPVVGGNLSRGEALSLTTTVVGELDGSGLGRRGARPGDGVFVTGAPGAAALGLELLLRDEPPPEHADAALEAWREPVARIGVGRALIGHATAAVDVSDGLAQDLTHLLRASGVGARLGYADVPELPHFAAVAARLGLDPRRLDWAGGESYELVYTAPMDDPVAHELGTLLGRCEAGDALLLLDERGATVTPPGGYRHG